MTKTLEPIGHKVQPEAVELPEAKAKPKGKDRYRHHLQSVKQVGKALEDLVNAIAAGEFRTASDKRDAALRLKALQLLLQCARERATEDAAKILRDVKRGKV